MDMNAAVKIAATVTGTSAVDGLKHSLDGVSKSVEGVTGKFAGLMGSVKMLAGAVGVLGFGAMIKDVIDAGEELNDMAQKTGVSVEALSTFKMAGKLAGLSVEDLGKAIGKFDQTLSKANTGNKEAAAAFTAMGLSAKTLKDMKVEDALLKVADAFSKAPDGADKTRVAMEMFGKAGMNMIPLLNSGAEAIEAFGVKMTTDFAARADQFNDNLEILGAKTKIFAMQAATALLPTLQEMATQFLKLTNTKPEVAGFFDWVGEAVRLLSIGLVGAYNTLANVVDLVVTAGRAGWAKMTGDAAGAEKMVTDMFTRAKDRVDAMKNTTAALAKNSLVLGTGTVEQIKKRQIEETTVSITKPTNSINAGALDSGAAAKADAFKSQLQALGGEAAKLAWQSQHVDQYADKITSAKAAQMAFDIEFGKFKDLSASQKAQLMEAATAVDTYGNNLKLALAGLDYQNATDKINAETAAMGLNDTQRKIMLAGLELEQKGIKKGTELYDQLLAKRTAALNNANDTQSGFGFGVTNALNTYVDNATNSAKQVQTVLTNAFKGAEDALVNFVINGKASFADFTKAILSDLARIAMQKALAGIVGAIAGAFAGAAAGSVSGTGYTDVSPSGAGTYNYGGSEMTIGTVQAKGGAWEGGVQKFATGGVLSNKIVGQPTFFPMSGGKTGLLGEAGPEAIVPLKNGRGGLGVSAVDEMGKERILPITRGADGKLAVRMDTDSKFANGGVFNPTGPASIGQNNGSKQGGDHFNITVNVASDGTTTSNGEGGASNAQALGRMLSAAIKAELINQKRPGGLLAPGAMA